MWGWDQGGTWCLRMEQQPSLTLSVQSLFSNRSLLAAYEQPHFSFAFLDYDLLQWAEFQFACVRGMLELPHRFPRNSSEAWPLTKLNYCSGFYKIVRFQIPTLGQSNVSQMGRKTLLKPRVCLRLNLNHSNLWLALLFSSSGSFHIYWHQWSTSFSETQARF